MAGRRVRWPGSFTGRRELVAFGQLGLRWLALDLCRLGEADRVEGRLDGCEAVAVILSGTVTVEVAGRSFGPLGAREHVFAGRATAVYLPAGAGYAFSGGPAEVALCKARAQGRPLSPFVVRPQDVRVSARGREGWRREVHTLVGVEAEGRVERLVVGETYNVPGEWSSYPPHRHEVHRPPAEVALEEVYHYRLDPPAGFAVQLVYTEDGTVDEAYRVRDGDTVAIDRGYHPVVAAGGYRLYYLWFLAGPHGRDLVPWDDPAHAWLHREVPAGS